MPDFPMNADVTALFERYSAHPDAKPFVKRYGPRSLIGCISSEFDRVGYDFEFWTEEDGPFCRVFTLAEMSILLDWMESLPQEDENDDEDDCLLI